jgi:hypothetical protein
MPKVENRNPEVILLRQGYGGQGGRRSEPQQRRAGSIELRAKSKTKNHGDLSFRGQRSGKDGTTAKTRATEVGTRRRVNLSHNSIDNEV